LDQEEKIIKTVASRKKAKTKYVVEGQIEDIAAVPVEEFGIKVYAVRDGKVLGVGTPNEEGEFKIEFEHRLEIRVGVRLIVGPDIPDKYHEYIAGANVCMETVEHYVPAKAWEKKSAYVKMERAITVAHLVDHWRFWMRPFHVSGRVLFKDTGRGVPFAIVEAIEVDALPGGGYNQDLIGVDVANSCGNFKIEFPWFLVLIPPSRPDLIFRVKENIDGNVRVIYEEDPTETRWDMVDNSWVFLLVDEECTWVNPPPTDQPGDCSFLFTRVGLKCVDRICSNGYNESSKLPVPGTGDQPFGVRHGSRPLDICGWFGEASDVTHYRIQYRKAGSATWKDISDPTSNKYYDRDHQKWVTMHMGPTKLGLVKNLYTTPYLVDRYRPWYLPDLLVQWDSRNSDGNGIYSIRVIGYKWDGTHLTAATCLDIDPAYGVLDLQIDNTAPTSRIISIMHVKPGQPPSSVQPCDIVTFENGDELRVTFEASDALGHLLYYRLDAMYSHDCRVTPRPPGAVDQYAPAHINPTQRWGGGVYTAVYKASDYGVANGSCVPNNMPTCAYQFRIGVRKRTTSGYGLIYHWVEDTTHITIMRPPTPIVEIDGGFGGTVVPPGILQRRLTEEGLRRAG
jgi:hypothetical protein